MGCKPCVPWHLSISYGLFRDQYKLVKVNLSNNNLDEKSTKFIGDFICLCQNLQSFDLSWNKIDEEAFEVDFFY
jgi:hypothetical protein